HSRIQLRPRQHNLRRRRFEAWQIRPGCERRGIQLLATTSATSATRPTTATFTTRKRRCHTARPADRTIRSAGSSRYTASTAGARENVRTSAGPPAIATTFTAPGATSATTLVPQVRHRISRHEHSALHPDAFRPLKFRMSNVDPQRPIARRVRPDKHPVRIALILRDVLLQPLNHF